MMTHPSPHLTNLPIEILSTIFGYLDQPGHDLVQCTLINWQFYRFTNPLLWRHIHFIRASQQQQQQQQRQQVRERFLSCLLLAKQSSCSPSHSIRSLHLHRMDLTDEWLTSVLRHVPLLESLVMDNTNDQFDYRDARSTLNQLGERCPQLKSLVVRHMPLTPAFFQSVGRHCHQLETFRLTIHFNKSRLPANLFTKCFHQCPRIETLEVEFINCPCCSSSARCGLHAYHRSRWESTKRWTPDVTSRSLPALKRLMIRQTHRGMLHHAMQVSLATRQPCWPQLTSLVLQVHTPLLDHQVIGLIRDCCQPGHLLHLHIMYAQLTDATLKTLANVQPHLQVLDVSSSNRYMDRGFQPFTAVGIRYLIRHCLQLRVLGLDQCFIQKTDLLPPPPPPQVIDAADTNTDTHTHTDNSLYFKIIDLNTINKIRLAANSSSSSSSSSSS